LKGAERIGNKGYRIDFGATRDTDEPKTRKDQLKNSKQEIRGGTKEEAVRSVDGHGIRWGSGKDGRLRPGQNSVARCGFKPRKKRPVKPGAVGERPGGTRKKDDKKHEKKRIPGKMELTRLQKGFVSKKARERKKGGETVTLTRSAIGDVNGPVLDSIGFGTKKGTKIRKQEAKDGRLRTESCYEKIVSWGG